MHNFLSFTFSITENNIRKGERRKIANLKKTNSLINMTFFPLPTKVTHEM